MDTMNVYLAIRWVLQSWNHHVSMTTIYNCFRKSTLLINPIALPTPITPDDTPQLYEQVLSAGNIRDSMAISNFLNPEEEEVDMQENGSDPESILQEVLDEHLGVQSTQNDDYDDEQPMPVRSVQEAQQALEVLIEYTVGQDALQAGHLRALERLENELRALKINSQVQSTLDRWIM